VVSFNFLLIYFNTALGSQGGFFMEFYIVLKKLSQVRFVQALLGAFFMFSANVALAQNAGFLQPANDVLEQVKDAVIAISVVVAIIYIVWQVLEVIFDRKTWSDILGKCLVAIALGAAPYIVMQLWELGKSLSL
jgi:hypothetical protein